MLKLANRTKEVNWLMAAEIDNLTANGSLFVPDLLNQEGKEFYSSYFRDAAMNFDEEWWADTLLKEGLVAASEAPAREAGAAAHAVSPNVIEALVKGEFNRLYCRVLCQVAVESKVPEVVIYQAEESAESIPECAKHEGRRVNAQALHDWLRTASLDDFLGMPSQCRKSVLSVCLP